MSDPTTEAPAPAPAPAKASLGEDFVDIFTSPSAVFARRANSGFFLMMVILTVVLGALYFVNRGALAEIMDAEISRALAQAAKANPSMTEAQLEAGKKVAHTTTMIGAFVGVPIVLLFTGLGAWIVSKILGGAMSFGAAMTVAAYAYCPRVLESVGVLAQGVLLDTTKMTGKYQLSLGVGRFLDPEMSPGLLGLLGRVDLITLWITVLFAIGIGVVAKLPKNKWAVAGVMMWVWGAIPALWQVVRG